MGKGADLKIPEVTAPPVQGPQNEPESDFTVPLVELKDAPSVDDEKDTAMVAAIVHAPPVQPTDNERPDGIKVQAIHAPPVQPTDNEPLKKTVLPLSGKLITAEDPLAVGKNFRTLTNMRYGDAAPKTIGGMTKINTNVMDGTYLKTRSAFHFKKIQVAETVSIENHVLAQAYNTGITASSVLENATSIPDAGNFVELMTLDVAPAAPGWKAGDTITGQTSSKTCIIVRQLTSLTYHIKNRSGTYTLGEILSNGTTTADQGAANPTFTIAALWTDSAGAGKGFFCDATNGQVVYCNGVDACIWGGNGIPISRFLNFDSALSFFYNYTDIVSNSKITDTITLNQDAGAGGAGADVALLLHLDNNVTDSGPTGHTVTNNNVTFITSSYKFGTHSAEFNGTTARLTIPDHADFNFSDGTWTVDMWVEFGISSAYSFYYQETPVTKIIFSSGSHEVAVNDTVTQTASGATGTVLSVSVTSGTWAGGDAAGTIWLGSVTGTWTDGSTMIETTDQLAGSGDFTGGTDGWTLAAGWVYGTDDVLKNGDGIGTLSKDTLAAVVGQVYNVTYTISSLTAGDVTASFGGASGTARSANGTYTETLTAVSTAGLAFTPSNTARFTIDAVAVKIVPLTCTTCSTDVQSFHLRYVMVGSEEEIHITLRSYGISTDIVSVGGLNLVYGLWHHLEFSENGNTWYIFIDGNIVATGTSTSRAENYTSTLFIGNNNNTVWHIGYIDELRVSKTCRHTANFAVPTSAYAAVGGSGGIGKVYIQTPRPAKGFKFYVSHANASAAVASGGVWNGSSFAALTLTDGTIGVAGKTLSQTGSITFATTVGTAKVKYLHGTLAYTYEFSFSGIDADTAIYHVTADCPFQQIPDLWDGIERSIAQFYLYKTAYQDYTINVYEDRYDSTDPTSFVELDGLTSSQQIEVGFFERQTALNFVLGPGHVNTTANTLATVYYWTGSAYTLVGTITDGTSAAVVSLANPGTISWDAPAETAEQQKIINNGIPLYFYKVVWNQTLSADVQISHVSGLPAQKTIRGYKFPLYSQDSLMLCCNIDERRNSVLIAAQDNSQVFNGDGSTEVEFGDNDELNGGCSIFSQYGSNLFNITMFFKDREIWNLVRGANNSWQRYRVSESVGCPAGQTIDTVIIPPIEGQQQNNRSLAIWEGNDGVYVSEGRHPVCVSNDIRDLWDQNATTHINASYLKSHYGKVDKANKEYHLFIATTTGTVTTLDDEWVLDLRRWKWYHVNRTSGLKIQCMINVTDAYGVNYPFGFIDTGYMERMEYGTTFDGQSIISTWQTGDFPLIEGDYFIESEIKALVPVLKAKTVTTADATLTLYTDTGSTGVDYTVDPTSAGYRLAFPVKTANSVPGILHSIKGTITVSNETCGFEPFLVGIFYQPVREKNY